MSLAVKRWTIVWSLVSLLLFFCIGYHFYGLRKHAAALTYLTSQGVEVELVRTVDERVPAIFRSVLPVWLMSRQACSITFYDADPSVIDIIRMSDLFPVVEVFSDGKFSDNELLAIASLTELEVLDLEGSLISNNGISAVEHMTDLSDLSLADTEITDSGLIDNQLPQGIIYIDVSNTVISREGAIALISKLGNLERINLHATSVTADEIRRLRDSYPALTIDYE